MAKKIILVVDDEPSILQSLRGALLDEGFWVETAADGQIALKYLRDKSADVILLDIWLPDIDGILLLKQIREERLAQHVIVMSGHGNVETAVRATKLGAFDFLEKPISLERLMITIKNLFELQELSDENTRLKGEIEQKYEMIGYTAPILELKKQIDIAAPTNSWVLVSGENGTGKELVARSIHALSLRRTAPFVEINCAAIPEDLIESELFGYERGAFTGASLRKKGKFELATGGTLFLDEIADMSLKTQAKILRVLQEKTVYRLGGSEPIEIDVRIIAATNKDLGEEIRKGNFREDLYYRLNVIPLYVAPLREKKEDIPELVQYFVQQIAKLNGRKIKEVSSSVILKLQEYYWPGNVRELKNVVERMVILSQSPVIGEEDLTAFFLSEFNDAKRRGRGGVLEELDRIFQHSTFREAKGDFERAYLLRKLQEFKGNVSRTAEAIEVERSHLHRKIRSYNIEKIRT